MFLAHIVDSCISFYVCTIIKKKRSHCISIVCSEFSGCCPFNKLYEYYQKGKSNNKGIGGIIEDSK